LIKKFLSYVEIMTKITSVFPFFYTIGFLLVLNQKIDIKLSVIFFASMFLFDLTTTAINNYIDTKDNHQTLQFGRKTAFAIIVILFSISTALGIYLAYLTDIVVFLLGAICFAFGVFYTFGPVPISRQPLGEFFSGLFYGLIIPFILLYINTPKGYFLTFEITAINISLDINIVNCITVLLLAVAPAFATSNIMLANNTCDLEHDIAVRRHTLPYFIGVKNSVKLFALLYYGIYLSSVLLVIFRIVHPIYLLSLLSIIIVQKNINIFKKEQIKTKTFVVAVKNFIIIMSLNVIMMFICGLIS
jgi:1,4-dihydroxy-2-naphthoate octaprenyltransferase